MRFMKAQSHRILTLSLLVSLGVMPAQANPPMVPQGNQPQPNGGNMNQPANAQPQGNPAQQLRRDAQGVAAQNAVVAPNTPGVTVATPGEGRSVVTVPAGQGAAMTQPARTALTNLANNQATPQPVRDAANAILNGNAPANQTVSFTVSVGRNGNQNITGVAIGGGRAVAPQNNAPQPQAQGGGQPAAGQAGRAQALVAPNGAAGVTTNAVPGQANQTAVTMTGRQFAASPAGQAMRANGNETTQGLINNMNGPLANTRITVIVDDNGGTPQVASLSFSNPQGAVRNFNANGNNLAIAAAPQAQPQAQGQPRAQAQAQAPGGVAPAQGAPALNAAVPQAMRPTLQRFANALANMQQNNNVPQARQQFTAALAQARAYVQNLPPAQQQTMMRKLAAAQTAFQNATNPPANVMNQTPQQQTTYRQGQLTQAFNNLNLIR